MANPDALKQIDIHSIEVATPVDEVWPIVWRVVARSFSGRKTEAVAALLGCAPRRPQSAASPQANTTTLAGFRVTAVEPPQRFVLEGAHRFARYRLAFEVEAVGARRCQVRAETHAYFPGFHGRVYRALVIGSRGHVLVLKRMTRIKQRAESAAGAPARATEGPAA